MMTGRRVRSPTACLMVVKPLRPHRLNAHAKNHGMNPGTIGTIAVIVIRAPIAVNAAPQTGIATQCARMPDVAVAASGAQTTLMYQQDHHRNAPRLLH